MSNINSLMIGWLQDVRDTTEDVMCGLIDDDLHITPDNHTEWEEALHMLQKLYPLIVGLRRHTFPASIDDNREHRTYSAKNGRLTC